MDAEHAYHPPVKNARDVATVTDNVAWKEKGEGANMRKVDPVISCASSRWKKSYLHRHLLPSISAAHSGFKSLAVLSLVLWSVTLPPRHIRCFCGVSRVLHLHCITLVSQPCSLCSSQLLYCFSDSLSTPMFPPAPHPPH